VLVPAVSGGKEESRVREIVMMNFGDAVVSTEGGGMLVAFKERYEAEEVQAHPPVLGAFRLIVVYGKVEGDWRYECAMACYCTRRATDEGRGC
jgi:hypothetical protein